jgi:hypothetical protein
VDISSRKGTDRCKDEHKSEDDVVKEGVRENICFLGTGTGNRYVFYAVSPACNLIYPIEEVPESKTTIDSLGFERVPGMSSLLVLLIYRLA